LSEMLLFAATTG